MFSLCIVLAAAVCSASDDPVPSLDEIIGNVHKSTCPTVTYEAPVNQSMGKGTVAENGEVTFQGPVAKSTFKAAWDPDKGLTMTYQPAPEASGAPAVAPQIDLNRFLGLMMNWDDIEITRSDDGKELRIKGRNPETSAVDLHIDPERWVITQAVVEDTNRKACLWFTYRHVDAGYWLPEKSIITFKNGGNVHVLEYGEYKFPQ